MEDLRSEDRERERRDAAAGRELTAQLRRLINDGCRAGWWSARAEDGTPAQLLELLGNEAQIQRDRAAVAEQRLAACQDSRATAQAGLRAEHARANRLERTLARVGRVVEEGRVASIVAGA